MVAGPNPRYISNRVFDSLGIDLFSPRNVSQWAWIWGQFLDHTFGLAEAGSTEDASIPFDSSDPLESFTNTLGPISMTRNAVANGTGTSPSNPRQQVNTVNSYIDGWPIYGGTQQRLAWLRTGPDNGNAASEGADLMLPGGYLPHASARGDVSTAPTMTLDGNHGIADRWCATARAWSASLMPRTSSRTRWSKHTAGWFGAIRFVNWRPGCTRWPQHGSEPPANE
jgi:hypothetical protein